MDIKLRPSGFNCKIENCPPGMFLYENQICFKSEYGNNNGDIEVFNDAGEYFTPRNVIVTPLEYEIYEIDD